MELVGTRHFLLDHDFSTTETPGEANFHFKALHFAASGTM
jgi:hypothetical protein